MERMSSEERLLAGRQSRHGRRDGRAGTRPPFLRLPLSTSQRVALSFLGLIAVGSLLLWLPASQGDQRVGLLDSVFTATSAVCVTGLIVVDTGTAWSAFGQGVIALLIQLGGLGVLTAGTLLAVATGRRLGVGHQLLVREQVRAVDLDSVGGLLKAIMAIVFGTELVGALLLYTPMAADVGPLRGIWHAAFHSISAFNNAGFALYPDSLTRHAGSWWVSSVIMALVVVGGLGFIVIVNLEARVRSRRRQPLTLHTRMALAATAFLVLAAFVVLLVFEWSNDATLGTLPLHERLLASLFQAVTPRTAGFNTLDYADMAPASLVVTILLMFIGGNPGSTAGGIKTVTFFVLVLGVWSVVRGRPDATVFGRRLDTATVVRAGAIVSGAVLVAGGALTLLALVEPDLDFLALLFETVSALGTVGLSMGITADLGETSRVIVIALMFVGRIGFLTFALALVDQGRPGRRRLLAEEVVIG